MLYSEWLFFETNQILYYWYWFVLILDSYFSIFLPFYLSKFPAVLSFDFETLKPLRKENKILKQFLKLNWSNFISGLMQTYSSTEPIPQFHSCKWRRIMRQVPKLGSLKQIVHKKAEILKATES